MQGRELVMRLCGLQAQVWAGLTLLPAPGSQSCSLLLTLGKRSSLQLVPRPLPLGTLPSSPRHSLLMMPWG